MKNQELFNKTVAILVKAYHDNTLEHTNCYACAVQNIVAGNMGLDIIPIPKRHSLRSCENITVVIEGMKYEETLVASLGENGDEENILSASQRRQMLSTGYSYEQLSEIERAFEGVSYWGCKDKYIFNGLMAVIDCLMEIHEATTEEATEAKELFVKA